MRKIAILFTLILFLMIGTNSCDLINKSREKVSEVKMTADAIATQVQQGKDLISTGKAFATEFAENQIVQTAKAIATNEGSKIIGTSMAIVTEQGPIAIATLNALGTQVKEKMQGQPEDIPIIDADVKNFITTNNVISYSVVMEKAKVVGFYKNNMPRQGWSDESKDILDSEQLTSLLFKKGDRTANMVFTWLAGSSTTTVMIVVSP